MAANVDDAIRETMTLEEIAARLGIGMTKAYELAKADKLPVPRLPIPGPYRFSRRAYDALMERQHTDAGRDAA
jgi:excisionase family DNA binding protein